MKTNRRHEGRARAFVVVFLPTFSAMNVQRDTVDHANERYTCKKHTGDTAKATASSACVRAMTHAANEKSRYSRDVGRDRLEFPLSLGPDVKRGTDDEHQQDRDADARSYARRFQHDLSPGSCVKNKKIIKTEKTSPKQQHCTQYVYV